MVSSSTFSSLSLLTTARGVSEGLLEVTVIALDGLLLLEADERRNLKLGVFLWKH
jgi:hypothetical protein